VLDAAADQEVRLCDEASHAQARFARDRMEVDAGTGTEVLQPTLISGSSWKRWRKWHSNGLIVYWSATTNSVASSRVGKIKDFILRGTVEPALW